MNSLSEILVLTKDGEWGSDTASTDTCEMLVIRGTDFSDVELANWSDVPLRHIPAGKASQKKLQPYDIVIETAGGTKDRPTGRALLLRETALRGVGVPVSCASFSRFLRVDDAKANSIYIYYLLRVMYDLGLLRKFNTQHTGLSRFQYTKFAAEKCFWVPDRGAQDRVAAHLLAYDDLIENNARRIRVLEEMARALYREWFVQFRYPGHERDKKVPSAKGAIPEGWAFEAVSALGDYVNGYAFKPSDFAGEGVPIVKIRELKAGVDDSTPRYQGQLRGPLSRTTEPFYARGPGPFWLSCAGCRLAKEPSSGIDRDERCLLQYHAT
ncbi:MAG: hypothetical protein U0326_14545 [Polyangiales bacterium]